MNLTTTLFTQDTDPHLLGPLGRLRHRIFVEREGYDVPTFEGTEYDQFDVPGTYYVLVRDHIEPPPQPTTGSVALDTVLRQRGSRTTPVACLRLIPTDRRHMIPELWAGTALQTPRNAKIWEVSRFGVDAPEGRPAARELVLALADIARVFGLEAYLFLANPRVIQNLLGPHARVDVLGPILHLGRRRVAICKVDLNEEALRATEEHWT